MTTLDDAKATIAHIEEHRSRLEAALARPVHETPEAWSQEVREAVRALVEDALPECLPPGPTRPEDQQDCGKYAALSYALAAELVHFYPERQKASALSRGLVLDLWDMWWSRAGGIAPGEESRSPASMMPEGVLDTGYIIDPMVLRSTLSALDDDLARIFSGSDGYDDEGRLYRQGIWLLQRLHRKHFRAHERVVLYELLRLRHWRIADRSVGLATDSLERIIKAAGDSKISLHGKGRQSMPTASERAFEDDLGATSEDAALMLETLQVLRSAVLYPNAWKTAERREDRLAEIGRYLLKKAGELRIETSVQLDGETVKVRDRDVTALLRRLAARSRVIRGLCRDLLKYDFPTPAEFKPPDMPASSCCDCWVSVIGHRQTGKTTFMRSLVAALMPEGSNLKMETNWTESRARIVSKDDFAESPKYTEIINSESTKKRLGEEMVTWLDPPEDQKGTETESKTIAEISTPHMARLRFFDLAGEDIFKYDFGEMEEHTRKLLRARKPVATIYMDSEDWRLRKGTQYDNDRIQYESAVKDAFTENGPVYIVFNKADKIRAQYEEGEALTEIDESISYKNLSDHPEECDADYDPGDKTAQESFLSTRTLELPDRDITHLTILDHIDKLPSIVRRPFFHDRIRKDIRAVGRLLDALLARGRRDISFVYLVSAPDGRTIPEDLSGTRQLWADLEKRVLTSTRESRKASLRVLLQTRPKDGSKEAGRAYSAFDAIFGSKDGKATDDRDETMYQDMITWIRTLSDLEKDQDRVPDLKALIANGRGVIADVKNAKSLKGILDKNIEGFLPELGFLPTTRKSSIQAAAQLKRMRLEQREEIKITADSYATQIEEWLTEKKFNFHKGRISEILSSGIMQIVTSGVGGEAAEETAANRKAGGFDFDSGAKAPIGPGAGSPIHDGDITFAAQQVIDRNTVQVIIDGNDIPTAAAGDWSFLQGLLAMNIGRKEKVALAKALYNFCSPDEARYPELILKSGDHDFYRTRVLTSEDQLANELEKFRTDSIEVLGKLLHIRTRLYELDFAVVLDLAMAHAIHTALADNELLPVEDLVKADDNKAAAALHTFCNHARKLVNEVEHGRINEKAASVRDAIGRRLKSKATIYAELYQLGDRRSVWYRLDRHSHDIAATGNVSPADAYRIRDAGRRCKIRVQLYDLLDSAVERLRGNKEKHAEARAFLDDPKLGIDTDLFQRLSLLHAWRLYLLNAYPLLYLDMAQWIGDSTPKRRIEQSDNPELFRHLNEGAIAVKEKFESAYQQRLDLPRGDEIAVGAPFGNAQVAWEDAERARKDFVELLLDDARMELIWGPGA